jgi:hypothetical protein
LEEPVQPGRGEFQVTDLIVGEAEPGSPSVEFAPEPVPKFGGGMGMITRREHYGVIADAGQLLLQPGAASRLGIAQEGRVKPFLRGPQRVVNTLLLAVTPGERLDVGNDQQFGPGVVHGARCPVDLKVDLKPICRS